MAEQITRERIADLREWHDAAGRGETADALTELLARREPDWKPVDGFSPEQLYHVLVNTRLPTDFWKRQALSDLVSAMERPDGFAIRPGRYESVRADRAEGQRSAAVEGLPAAKQEGASEHVAADLPERQEDKSLRAPPNAHDDCTENGCHSMRIGFRKCKEGCRRVAPRQPATQDSGTPRTDACAWWDDRRECFIMYRADGRTLERELAAALAENEKLGAENLAAGRRNAEMRAERDAAQAGNRIWAERRDAALTEAEAAEARCRTAEAENAKLREERDRARELLRDGVTHLRNVLDRNEAEARLQAAAQTATENYTDDTPDIRAWEHAMIISSDAESDARIWLTHLAGDGGDKNG